MEGKVFDLSNYNKVPEETFFFLCVFVSRVMLFPVRFLVVSCNLD